MESDPDRLSDSETDSDSEKEWESDSSWLNAIDSDCDKLLDWLNQRLSEADKDKLATSEPTSNTTSSLVTKVS
ncbi:hypothetical protein [Streptococcus suis]